MQSVLLKIDPLLLGHAGELAQKLHTSRNRYIADAVDYYNQVNRRKLLAETLTAESRKVRAESMHVLRELESLDDDAEI